MTERPDTKTRILDAAEKLFGENGFDATSLRDITTEADVNLAAVNYHFQSKDSLIDATILRTAAPVNQKRIAMLDAAGPKPTVEQIVEAFVGPVLEQDFEPMAPLMGRVLASPETMQRVFKHHMETLSRDLRMRSVWRCPTCRPLSGCGDCTLQLVRWRTRSRGRRFYAICSEGCWTSRIASC